MIYTSTTVPVLSTERNPVIGYRNIVTLSTISATSSQTNFPVTNLANPATVPPWKANAGGSPLAEQYLTIIPSAAQTIDYLAVAAHNFKTAMATLRIETCASIGTSPQVWTAHTFGASADVVPLDDGPLIFRIAPSTAYQGIRLHIIPGGAVQPQAGVAFVGELLVLERSVKVDVDYTPEPMARMSKVVSDRSESGNFLGRIVLSQWTQSEAAFSYFTSAWYRANMKPFVDQSDENPFFFAWTPVEHPEDTGFVWMSEDPRAEIAPVIDRIHLTIRYAGLTS